MTKDQIYDSIERTGSNRLQVKHFGGGKLIEIHTESPQKAVMELEEVLPNYVGYKKLEIIGKKGAEDVPWSKGYSWHLEYATGGVGEANKGVAGIPTGAISATEYIGMAMSWMEKNFNLQKELMEIQMKQNNQDPSKWLPIVREIAPMFGLELRTGGIAGTPETGTGKTLEFEHANETLNEDQIGEAIMSHILSLSKKVKGSQMLKIVEALDKNPEIHNQADNLAKILLALAEKPSRIDLALQYL